MNAPLFLVDGYSLIYRAYFAFIRRPLTNSRGQNTSAIFGFFSSLFQLLRLKSPSFLAVVLDSRTPTFRHKKYPEYKANREKAPQDLHDQVPVIEEILSALGISCLRQDGFEADDLIATLAERCRQEGRECYILSGDKDLLQLVGGGVYVIQPPKGADDFQVLDREGVFSTRSVYPEQIVDYLALTGDQSDNVPGVAGVGDKTAVKLLTEYADLDKLYKALVGVQPAGVKKKLEEGKVSALLSRELVMLRSDVPLDVTIQDLSISGLNREAAVPLFAAQDMSRMVQELGGSMEEHRETGQLKTGIYETVLTSEAMERWIAEVRKTGVFAFDTETDSLDALHAHPVGFSLAVAKGRACYIPVRTVDREILDLQYVLNQLAGLLTDPTLMLVGQNIKYDYKVMAGQGIVPRCRFFDTMIAAWLLDSGRSSYSMDNLALQLLNYRTIHYTDVVGKEEGKTLADVPLEQATDYSAEDADITFQLYQLFQPQLEAEGLTSIFADLEMPLVGILSDMEITGIRLNADELRAYSTELEGDLSRLEEEIFSLCGRSFNVRSTKELQVILFGELGLPPVKKTKTGQSTDNYVLMELARSGNKVPELVLNHRLLTKLKSTYVDALPELVNPDSGRLHTHYIQTGAATGRLASKDPNLQNIPVREESGRHIRRAFVPDDGCSFLSADYSQIELVVLAHLSGDPMLQEAFRKNRDIHRQTAAILFGVTEEQVNAEQRRIGKTINFGVIYGMSAFRLARDLRIPRRDAEEFIQRYFERYAGVDRFIRQTIRQAEEKGYVETIMGRRRPIAQINSRNRTEKMAAERVAMNSPIQGSAADIVKQAMIDVTRALSEQKMASRLLLQVHDELIFEVPDTELEQAGEVVRGSMEQAVTLSIPLRVSLEVGSTWGDIH
ncbi:MAG: DNA polymerase I [Spirochaetaceae bacterium]|nr:MAG: DNA polymerase I [Spirochaetaceae bacterium]